MIFSHYLLFHTLTKTLIILKHFLRTVLNTAVKKMGPKKQENNLIRYYFMNPFIISLQHLHKQKKNVVLINLYINSLTHMKYQKKLNKHSHTSIDLKSHWLKKGKKYYFYNRK